MSTTPKVTGPTHPLVAAYAKAKRTKDLLREHHTATATAIMRDHRDHGVSDSTVYSVSTASNSADWRRATIIWKHKGAAEACEGFANQPGYITVRGIRDQASARNNGPYSILGQIFPDEWRRVQRYGMLLEAANHATPQAAFVLAIAAAGGYLEWDTGESIHAAAHRIALDAAWNLRDVRTVANQVTAEHVMDELRRTYHQHRTVTEFATEYLENREAILAALEEEDIRVGDQMLTTEKVAEVIGKSTSTWRSYISQGKAPAADLGVGTRTPQWYPMTVAAWRVAQGPRSTPSSTA